MINSKNSINQELQELRQKTQHILTTLEQMVETENSDSARRKELLEILNLAKDIFKKLL